MLENTAFSMLASDDICLQSQFVTLNLVSIIYTYIKKCFMSISPFLIFGPKSYTHVKKWQMFFQIFGEYQTPFGHLKNLKYIISP